MIFSENEVSSLGADDGRYHLNHDETLWVGRGVELVAKDVFEIAALGQGVRARPDQGHVAFQHIQQLRQFVDTRRSQQLADGGYPRIVTCRFCDGGPVLLDPHCPEFKHNKLSAIESFSVLPKNNRPWTVKFDRNRSE